MILALHELGHITKQAEQIEKAIRYWFQSLKLAQETNNAEGIFHTAGTLGRNFLQTGQQEQGRHLLELSISMVKQGGVPRGGCAGKPFITFIVIVLRNSRASAY